MEGAKAFVYSKWGAVTLGAAFLYLMTPGPVQQGTGFVDFVKDKKIKGSSGAAKRGAVKPSTAETSINNFFKDKAKPRKAVPTGRETDFTRFLKSTAVEDTQQTTQAAEEVDPLAGKPAVDVLLLYGTEYGFSKEICSKVQDTLRKTGAFRPTMLNMADIPAGLDFAGKGFQAALVMCSTQGDGVPPSEARDFCDWLGSPKAPALKALPFGVLALGDKAYVHFCRCGKTLDARFEELGGKRVVDRVDVDREDWPVVDAWISSALDALVALKLKPQMPKALANGNGVHADAPAAALPPSKSRPYSAKLVAKEGLCTLSGPDDKDTIRLEFDIAGSGLEYLPGDALGVYPRNEPMEVARVLHATGASGKEPLPAPQGHYAKGQLSLREALAACFDLRSPRGALLELLAKRAAGEEAQELRALLSEEGGANADRNKALDKWLSVRHVSDILEGCPSVQLTYQELLPALKPLQPRLYSISSSPLEAQGRVQITVATVRYKALDRPRVGVCSTFLGERLNLGETAPVYVTKNPEFRLPASPRTPVIMVGPGTGLAPFRAFIKHRLLEHPGAAARGPMVLYFGCRHKEGRSCDYLYGPQLEAWGADGTLELHTAFSRDTDRKVYVQHRLAETAGRVWELLEQGAHFYVCGDANHMAGDVDRELRKLIAERAEGGEAAAEAYVKRLEEEHRYERDVWFS